MGQQGEKTVQYLYLGKAKDDGVVRLQEKNLRHHILIVGQSGSGKSFMVGRLIEEMVLNTDAKIVILDLNADFGQLDKINKAVWDQTKEKDLFPGLLREEYDYNRTAEEFEKAWTHKTNKEFLLVSKNPPNKMCISWDTLSKKELRELLGLELFKEPEAVRLIDLLKDQSMSNKWTFAEWKNVNSLMVKWVYKYFPECDAKFQSLASYISIVTSIPAVQRVATALDDAFDYGIWTAPNDVGAFDNLFDREPNFTVQKLPRITCIDLNSIYDELPRLFVTRYLLERLWRGAVNDRRRTPTKNGTDEPVPIFVVVDEAHRLAPNLERVEKPLEAEVFELFQRFAAEGRKNKLFLVLITQRPSKLHPNILSECDNLCVMHIASDTDRKLLGESFGFTDKDKETLVGVGGFKTGQALFAGGWVENKVLEALRVAPRRTKY